MLYNNVTTEDEDLIIALARVLTGTKVTSKDHGIIVQNVTSRIVETGHSSLDEYVDYVDTTPNEMAYLLSALTIHTTSWFREAAAFKQLEKFALSWLESRVVPGPFKLLSIACSTGEEVYSAAYVLEKIRQSHPTFDYLIEGWDIDPISLRTARQGRYSPKAILGAIGINQSVIGTIDPTSGLFLINSRIQDRCILKTVNVISPPSDLIDSYDFVFCRNMLIYFDNESILRIVSFIKRILRKNGKICVGVSETSALSGSDFINFGSAVYGKGKLPIQMNSRTSTQIQPATSPKADLKGSILVVDDEPEIVANMRETLTQEGFNVISAFNAEEALKIISSQPIALVMSDYIMPGLNGLQFLKETRKRGHKFPFIIISAIADQALTKEALANGCDEILLKPCEPGELVRLAKRHLPQNHVFTNEFQPKLILVGASTGGTEALIAMLRQMPSNCPPVMVVQHISANFAKDFADRLTASSGLVLSQMIHGETLENGKLYIALGDYHIGLSRVKDGKLKLALDEESSLRNGHRPSVDNLFESVAMANVRCFAALLTGMGKDGASGMEKLKSIGSICAAQSEETCVVFGMPKEAIRLGIIDFVGSPNQIRGFLDNMLRSKTQQVSTNEAV